MMRKTSVICRSAISSIEAESSVIRTDPRNPSANPLSSRGRILKCCTTSASHREGVSRVGFPPFVRINAAAVRTVRSPLYAVFPIAFLLLLVPALPLRSQPPESDAGSLSFPKSQAEVARQREELYRLLEEQSEYLRRQSRIVKTAAKVVDPTVVHIRAERLEPRAGRREQIEESGSGVIISDNDKFYVLTNGHVVKGAQPGNIDIRLADGRRLTPTHLWTDPPSDVAVLEISDTQLLAARIGDSDELDIGDFVLAVGSPFGLTNSVTFGIISAKGRRHLQLGNADIQFQDFLQTDAAINPGNSGGPLINLRGEVIGINSAIASTSGRNEGIGFSIPSNMVMAIARQLIEKGVVSRAFLGVTLDPEFGPTVATELELPRLLGARVTAITPDSPAQRAGLKLNDVIFKYNDKWVEDDTHLINMVSLTPIGEEATLSIFREGKVVHLTTKVGNRADFE